MTEVVLTDSDNSMSNYPYINFNFNIFSDVFADYEDREGPIKNYSNLHLFYKYGELEYKNKFIFISFEDMPSFVKYLDNFINNTIEDTDFTWEVPYRSILLSRMDKFEIKTYEGAPLLNTMKMTITPTTNVVSSDRATINYILTLGVENVIKFRDFCTDMVNEYNLRVYEKEWDRKNKDIASKTKKEYIQNHKYEKKIELL